MNWKFNTLLKGAEQNEERERDIERNVKQLE